MDTTLYNYTRNGIAIYKGVPVSFNNNSFDGSPRCPGGLSPHYTDHHNKG